MKTKSESKPHNNRIYLLELFPLSEQILERQAVKDKLEKLFYECAETFNVEIDSCDILFDYVAITMYARQTLNIDDLIETFKKYSSEGLLKEFGEFKQFVVGGSLWNENYSIELL